MLALDPDNLKALLNLAEIAQSRGDREKAFDLFQRATVVAPTLAQAHVSLGGTALELNRMGVAEQALTRAVALGGTQPDLHFNLGLMAEQRGQKDVAAREYRAEVAAYPDSVGAWVNLGLLDRQAGRVTLRWWTSSERHPRSPMRWKVRTCSQKPSRVWADAGGGALGEGGASPESERSPCAATTPASETVIPHSARALRTPNSEFRTTVARPPQRRSRRRAAPAATSPVV